MKKDYGTRMKELREKKNLKQKEACKFLGVSISSLSTYERGVREPDLETLVRMANLYNTTVDYILFRDNVPIISLADFSESQIETIKQVVEILSKEFQNKD